MKRLIEGFVKGIDIIASILMVLLTLVVFGEVLSRYVFNYPLIYTDELTKLLFPWVIFITVISVTKNEDHMSINYFRELMPRAAQKIAFLISKLVMLYFSVYMLISSYQIVKQVANQTMPMLRISKSWLYMALTVSFFFVIIIVVYHIVLILTNKLEPPREEDMYDLGNDS